MPPPPELPEHLYFIDHNVRRLGGHHYEFAHSVAAAARRLDLPTRFLVSRDVDPGLARATGAIPTFSDVEQAAARVAGGYLGRRLPRLTGVGIFAWQNWCFGRDLAHGLERLPPGRDLFVLPHASQNTLVGTARALRHRLQAGSRALFIFFAPPSRINSPVAFRAVKRWVRAGKILLGTDSEPLADLYRKLSGVAVQVVPLPYQIAPGGDLPPVPSTAGSPLRLLAPGELRAEKGSDLLAAAVADLHEPLTSGRLCLTFQTYLNPTHHDPVAEATRTRLLELATRYPAGAIALVDQPLASGAYHELLRRCDAMVLPYRRSSYARRSSGVLMEGLALGKPVVATAGTWLALQMESHGAGVTVPDGDPSALAAGILRLCADFPRLAAVAAARGDAWRHFHNPDNYLQMVRAHGWSAPAAQSDPGTDAQPKSRR